MRSLIGRLRMDAESQSAMQKWPSSWFGLAEAKPGGGVTRSVAWIRRRSFLRKLLRGQTCRRNRSTGDRCLKALFAKEESGR